jgi:hypothetical protein
MKHTTHWDSACWDIVVKSASSPEWQAQLLYPSRPSKGVDSERNETGDGCPAAGVGIRLSRRWTILDVFQFHTNLGASSIVSMDRGCTSFVGEFHFDHRTMRDGCSKWAGSGEQEWCRVNCCEWREIVGIKGKEVIVRADKSDNLFTQFNDTKVDINFCPRICAEQSKAKAHQNCKALHSHCIPTGDPEGVLFCEWRNIHRFLVFLDFP